MKALRVSLALALASVAPGCNVDPYCFDCVETPDGIDGGVDASIGEGGVDTGRPRDAGPPTDSGPPPPDGCTPGLTESCNGADDDCDMLIDEGIDTRTSLDHCGGCGMTCSPAHAFGECRDGMCLVASCDVGYYDLDGRPDNGCEYRCVLTDPDDVRCDLRDNDCDGRVDEDVVLDSDPANCGSCGRTCRFSHAMGACTAGACVLGDCDPGFVDADGNPANGCEYTCIPATPPTETCNLRDDDCDARIDEGDPGGGATCGIDTGECATGIEQCVGGAISCVGGTSPTVELCNGLDDDCDSRSDEANPEGGRTCGSGVGVCAPGREVCTAGALVCTGAVGPVAETCNGLDDDCDSRLDEGDPGGGGTCGVGVGVCTLGALHCRGGVIACEGAVGGTTESCNGLDDDCDGRTDEGNPGGGGSCGTDIGACTSGTRACTGGALVCTGGTGPVAETCDSIDNDCDTRVDEGNPGGGASCGSSTGECRAGARSCVGGALVCMGGVGPSTETCNGRDDDCDGMTDEGNPGGGASCGSAVGTCRLGTRTCSGGALTCVGGTGPVAETCDALDNDCDTRIDEGNPGGGASCGSSVGQCTAGTRTCSGGTLTCTGGTGPTLEVCDTRDNDCDGATDEGFMLMTDISNCGMCGRVCSFPNALPRCTMGSCGILACQTGFYDLDGNPMNGCEYACSFAGAEACNGNDDDCDGRTDETLTPPATFCNPNGVCAGTAPTCSGAGGWVCNYPASYQSPETRCDGADNDCDGRTDEAYPLLGTSCNNGEAGACRRNGMFVCNAMQSGVVCNALPSGGGTAETCNGIDDDCDTRLDESAPGSWVQFTSGGANRWIMAYEASRPNSTAMSAGTMSHRVCSEPSRMPWTQVTYAQAQTACGTVGGRLCTETEWQDACRSTSGSCRWSYASSCSTYSATTCNGNDFDPIPGPPDDDVVLPTGSMPMCYANWGSATRRVFDMSGNVEEWAERRSAGVNPIRGGSMNDTAGGLECTFNFVVAGDTFQTPTVGFRCCRTSAP